MRFRPRAQGRSFAHGGRAAARSQPWRHGDQCRHGAGERRRSKPARARREGSPPCCVPMQRVAKADVAGPGFINLTLVPEVWPQELRRALSLGRDYGRSEIGAARKGQRRIRLRQSDRAAACRPWPRRGVRRRARQPARLCRLRRDARILHQRRRRPGRRAGALGLSALPRGARRGHRRHPGGALSRRLPQGSAAASSPPTTASSSPPCRRPNGCRSCASAPST